YLLVVIYMDIKFLIPLIISLIGGEMISAYSYKKIGGLTGDVYGAIIELSELVSLLSYWGVFIWI
ncbi:MAG: adenosylcobinamide-GDP ribazoletransferase, partial [Tissierellaceae bacterium]